MLSRLHLRALCRRPLTTIKPFRMASTLPKLPIFEAITSHDPERTAVIHSQSGRRFTYGQLVNNVVEAQESIRRGAGGQRLDGERLAFMAENGFDYVGADISRGQDVSETGLG